MRQDDLSLTRIHTSLGLLSFLPRRDESRRAIVSFTGWVQQLLSSWLRETNFTETNVSVNLGPTRHRPGVWQVWMVTGPSDSEGSWVTWDMCLSPLSDGMLMPGPSVNTSGELELSTFLHPKESIHHHHCLECSQSSWWSIFHSGSVTCQTPESLTSDVHVTTLV